MNTWWGRRSLAIAISTLLAAGVVAVAVATVDLKTEQPSVAATGTTTTMMAPAVPEASSIVPGSPPTTQATVPVEPATGAAAAPPTTTTTVVPGSVPPAAGTYPYRIRVTDSGGTDESGGVVVIEAAQQTGGEIRQVQRTRHEDEEGDPGWDEYAWRADGAYLTLFDFGPGADEDTFRCDYEPDVLVYPLPLTVGREWSVDSSCEQEGITLHERSTSRIARADRIVVAGEEVDVYVIERHEPLEEGVESEITEYFAPAVGLTVRKEGFHRYTGSDGEVSESTTEFELKTLKPQ